MRPLSAQEARRLLTTARGNRLEALYTLAVHTGMRHGELLALRWNDVSLGEPGTEPGVVSVHRTLTRTEDGNSVTLGNPKTKKSGLVPYA